MGPGMKGFGAIALAAAGCLAVSAAHAQPAASAGYQAPAAIAYTAAMQGRKAATLAAVQQLADGPQSVSASTSDDSGWGLTPEYAALVRFGLWDEMIALEPPVRGAGTYRRLPLRARFRAGGPGPVAEAQRALMSWLAGGRGRRRRAVAATPSWRCRPCAAEVAARIAASAGHNEGATELLTRRRGRRGCARLQRAGRLVLSGAPAARRAAADRRRPRRRRRRCTARTSGVTRATAGHSMAVAGAGAARDARRRRRACVMSSRRPGSMRTWRCRPPRSGMRVSIRPAASASAGPVSHRQAGRELLRAQHEAGVDCAHRLQLQQLRRDEVLVGFHARRHDAQQVVVGAAHRVALEHLGALLDELIELAHRFGVMVLERHDRVGEDRQTDGRRFQQRRVACDESGTLPGAAGAASTAPGTARRAWRVPGWRCAHPAAAPRGCAGPAGPGSWPCRVLYRGRFSNNIARYRPPDEQSKQDNCTNWGIRLRHPFPIRRPWPHPSPLPRAPPGRSRGRGDRLVAGRLAGARLAGTR